MLTGGLAWEQVSWTGLCNAFQLVKWKWLSMKLFGFLETYLSPAYHLPCNQCSRKTTQRDCGLYLSGSVFQYVSLCLWVFCYSKGNDIYICEYSLQLDNYLIKLHLVDGLKRKKWSLEGWKCGGLWNAIVRINKKRMCFKGRKIWIKASGHCLFPGPGNLCLQVFI